MESADVVEAGAFNKLPDVGPLEVLEVVVVGSAEVGAQGSVVAGNNDATLARADVGVDAVLDSEADLLDGVTQDIGVLILADTTEVDDAVGRQDVLRAAGRVLRRAARDQLRVVPRQQLLVQGQVLGWVREDRVVRFEPVFVEQGLVADCLDVCCGRGEFGRGLANM